MRVLCPTRRSGRASVAAAIALAVAAPARAAEVVILVAAPGYPGSTAQAQPTMDAFARVVERAAGWPAGRASAVYHEALEPALRMLEGGGVGMLVAPLPFFVEFGSRFGLRPVAQAETVAGARSPWVLVAGRGAPASPGDLAGRTLWSRAGYAPRFVREVALEGWLGDGKTLEVAFTDRILGVLRRASTGELVAVLLDGEQATALDSLPFRDGLQVLHRSAPLPVSLACVAPALDGEAGSELAAALLQLHRDEAARPVLEEMRLSGFVPLDDATRKSLERWAAGRP